MNTVVAFPQEGTSKSHGNMAVPMGVETGTQCQAVNHILARVGDKWSVRVVMALAEETRRFNELRRGIPAISQRMLTRTLRALERDGLVERTVFPTVPPRVDYSLTPLGKSLTGPVARLGQWAMDNIGAVEIARRNFDAQDDSDCSR